MPEKFAIVWNARYDPTYDMEREEGLIEENVDFCKRMGGLFWDHRWKRGFPYDGPFTGYIRDCMRDPNDKIVTHRATVEKVYIVTHSNPCPIPTDELKYIPEFRKECYSGIARNGDSHERSQVWFKLVDLHELSTPKRLDQLKRWNDPLKTYQGDYFRKYIKIVDKNYR